MKFGNTTIPSVLESFNSDLKRVTTNHLSGIKIKHNNKDYLVGELALREGNSPHKAINSSPEDVDYQVLMKSALLISRTMTSDSRLNVTTGFPFSTFQMNQKKTTSIVKEFINIIHDSRPYGGGDYIDQTINIGEVEVIPELLASIISSRNGEVDATGGMFLVSIGFGTLEIGLSTDDGFIQRTFNSGPGIRYAINSAMNKLQEKYYLGLRTEHQFDDAFHKGVITLNRKKCDISEVRRESLQEYYDDVISSLIKNSWTDDDFNKSNTLVLVGGGALYNDLVNAFRNEFDGILNVIVPDDPIHMASKGYAIHASRNSNDTNGESVGIDIGNAHTCISVISQNSAEDDIKGLVSETKDDTEEA